MRFEMYVVIFAAVIVFFMYVFLVLIVNASGKYTANQCMRHAGRILFTGVLIALVIGLGVTVNNSVKHQAQSVCNLTIIDNFCDN